MDAQKLEQIQKVFANDRFATDNGAVIEQVDEGYAKCWLEIQPHNFDVQIYYNQYLYRIAQKYGMKLIATSDVHAIDKDHMMGRAESSNIKSIASLCLYVSNSSCILGIYSVL